MSGLGIVEQQRQEAIEKADNLIQADQELQQQNYQNELDAAGISSNDLELEEKYIKETRDARRSGYSNSIETFQEREVIAKSKLAAEEKEAIRRKEQENMIPTESNGIFDDVVGFLAGNQFTRALVNGSSDAGYNTTQGINKIVDSITGVKDAIPQLFAPSEQLSELTGYDFDIKGIPEAVMTTLWNFFPMFGGTLKLTSMATNVVAKKLGTTGVQKGFSIAKPSGKSALQTPVVQSTQTLNKFGKFVRDQPRLLGATKAIIAEVPVSLLAFDPNDPTLFNHILNTKFLAEDGAAAGLLREYLTTNPNGDNNEANTVMANALLAVFTEGVFGIIGNTLNKVKRSEQATIKKMIGDTGDVTTKQFLQAIDNAPDDIKKQLAESLDADTRHLDEMKKEIDPEGNMSAKEVEEVLEEQGANPYNTSHRPERDFANHGFDDTKITSVEHEELFEAMMRAFKGNSKSLDNLSIKLGASALKEPDKYQRMLINIAKSLEKTMKTKNLDPQAFGSEKSLIDDFAKFSGVNSSEFNKQLANITQGVVAAKPYILASKAMLKMRIERQRQFLKEYLADSSERNYARFYDERLEVEASRLLTGNLASEVSDALRTYKFAKGTDDSELRNALLNKILRAPNVEFQQADAAYTKNLDDLHGAEAKAENTINTKGKKQRSFFCDGVA